MGSSGGLAHAGRAARRRGRGRADAAPVLAAEFPAAVTKVRIYPTDEQAAFLNAQFGAVRFA
ncbi:helix-turn-helix domain-containing protein, partial [Aeromonas sp. QDB66]|uniref:helix-turn-helix domain-containing protein n=1 Tax=Aeromonas sp. QDB66 TaxID=2989824 RepID=UPI003FA4A12B